MQNPSYIELYEKGILQERVKKLYGLLKSCKVCPHFCKVNRLTGERGFCRAGEKIAVADYGPHFGEEAPLVGRYGSGTIFLAYCNMRCIFCQNCDISSGEERFREVEPQVLGEIMLALQRSSCHNINIVSPSHYVPQVVSALNHAVSKGLHIPLVYNTGGYDRVEVLKLLEGIVDIYMPDMKYAREDIGRQLSGVKNYPETAKRALKEMYRQVGNLVTDDNGIAIKGVIIRHLVLPENLADTRNVMDFIAREVSPEAYVNIMKQYYPAHRAHEFKPLGRRITKREYLSALEEAAKAGIRPMN